MREKLLTECFESLELRSPSLPETARTIARVAGLVAGREVLELGAGTGRTGLLLAREFGCRVTITDLDTAALRTAQRRAEVEGLDKRIVVRPADLRQVAFPHSSFDLIVAEGAIYLLGFEEGFKEWRRVLRLGGYLAVTHLTWTRTPPPDRVREFWQKEYPKPLHTLDENRRIIDRAGYEPIHEEVLPPEAWDAYYKPLQASLDKLRARHANDSEALGHLRHLQDEIDCHYQWGGRESVGYVLYVARKMLC
ncbi:MAG: class I SAM-dependent methyltransferase [Planctomycetes bacterium]|nr:class I SAM-dependent methyltransferase [Planctomycetota bacterium]